jgi:hypothetical protein
MLSGKSYDNTDPGSKFPDVPPEHPYYTDISAAYAKGM